MFELKVKDVCEWMARALEVYPNAFELIVENVLVVKSVLEHELVDELHLVVEVPTSVDSENT